jgi:gamma-glutamylcyclotransferase (GGCT)/AIG2-like uncharacterized protein YtfP
MLIAVYGTLKQGYGNNAILSEGGAEFVGEGIVSGFKLYHAGFPVAHRSEGSTTLVEIWNIGVTNTSERAMNVLRRLDRLEGEGTMYNREAIVVDIGGQGRLVHMYIGNPTFWDFDRMGEERQDDEGNYYWERD